MEANKRSYQKHKTEYKITVKHYLNKNVSVAHNDANRHPVYLQITFQRKTTQVKSKYTSFLSDLEFNSLIQSLPQNMQDEIEQVKTVIERVTPYSQEFDIKQFTKEYNRSNRELPEVIDSRLKEVIVTSLGSPTLTESKLLGLDSDANYDVNNVESPIVRVINWERKAKDIISVFTPLMPELKKVKPALSSPIWSFEDYYGNVSRKFKRVYTWLDFQSGTFQRDLASTYENSTSKQSAINSLLKDINSLLSS